MVVYRRKNFTKNLALVIRYHPRYKTYQYWVYNRGGYFVVVYSRHYNELEECLRAASSMVDRINKRIQLGLPPISGYDKHRTL